MNVLDFEFASITITDLNLKPVKLQTSKPINRRLKGDSRDSVKY